jgi:hypothetical protein
MSNNIVQSLLSKNQPHFNAPRTGLNMMHKTLLDLIDAHISEGTTNYSDLDDASKETLVAHMIKITGTDAYECIIQPDDFTQTLHHFTQYLLKGEKEHALDLAQTMVKNAVDHYESELECVFSTRYEQKLANQKYENGLRPYQDGTTGETLWI